jgi:ketosteroid isomerase-like protein
VLNGYGLVTVLSKREENMFKKFMISFLLCCSSVAFAGQIEQNEAVHQELRALLKGLENAVNSERYDELAQYFHNDMTVTMSNQEVLHSAEEIGKFFAFWFGENGKLDHVVLKLEADALTRFYADGTMGVVHGGGVEDTYLSDERFFPMQTRWSATVIKDDDGKWRILSLHIGVNFLDNPVLNVIEDNGKNLILLGGLGGLMIGALFGWLIRRQRTDR